MVTLSGALLFVSSGLGESFLQSTKPEMKLKKSGSGISCQRQCYCENSAMIGIVGFY